MDLRNNELVLVRENNNHETVKASTEKPFILANTEEISLYDLNHRHIIPVHAKDNEPLISHGDFIESAFEAASLIYGEGNLASPVVRASHPVLGRIPEARHKNASELLDEEKTIYYQRMMFIIEIPAYSDEVNGNNLSLTVGGVKAYNLDNLNGKKGVPEHFKVFVGFRNSVCTNLCVSTDGLADSIQANSVTELKNQIYNLLCSYSARLHLSAMKSLADYYLTENQFAHLIGKCKMYHHLDKATKDALPKLEFNDSHFNMVCRDYYSDTSFCKNSKGEVNLWNLYNLFTSANKSSYIDGFLSRAENAFAFSVQLSKELESGSKSWFIS